MGKVKITWTTMTTERFSLDIDEAKLPENWQELLDGPTDDAHAFLGQYEGHYGESRAIDGDVLSRDAEFTVLDETDYDALAQALGVPHAPTFVSSAKYPNLLTVVCSCGESSFGAMTRESGEATHARHAVDLAGGHFRNAAATKKQLDPHTSARKAFS